MGLKYREYLNGKKVYGCSTCRSHLSTSDKVMSRDFQGQYGQAYLFCGVVNIEEGEEQQERNMTTGRHRIASISCIRCGTMLGWKYIKAYDSQQKYKEGKYILEKSLLRLVD
ncbi:hypothetical protein INT45_000279 [Circinella minor]|uniref:Protein yippee-like n=1 Tax=Circinella minor TaxID=1195481 RepID=A0A8H7SA38_9FUNG|nr:hypothetical protein INT45_000279 [Circinella minor]